MGTTTDRNDPGLKLLREDGQQEKHVVLSEEDRDKGFVRPLRTGYVHDACGSVTRMPLAIAETYAANPSFYGSTFCCQCRGYFPTGKDGEFTWDDASKEKVGT